MERERGERRGEELRRDRSELNLDIVSSLVEGHPMLLLTDSTAIPRSFSSSGRRKRHTCRKIGPNELWRRRLSSQSFPTAAGKESERRGPAGERVKQQLSEIPPFQQSISKEKRSEGGGTMSRMTMGKNSISDGKGRSYLVEHGSADRPRLVSSSLTSIIDHRSSIDGK